MCASDTAAVGAHILLGRGCQCGPQQRAVTVTDCGLIPKLGSWTEVLAKWRRTTRAAQKFRRCGPADAVPPDRFAVAVEIDARRVAQARKLEDD